MALSKKEESMLAGLLEKKKGKRFKVTSVECDGDTLKSIFGIGGDSDSDDDDTDDDDDDDKGKDTEPKPKSRMRYFGG